MNITVHAGHNPDGMIACGAVGYLKESTEARNVCQRVYDSLLGVLDVEDVTINDGKGNLDVLRRICAQCNKEKRDANISIHFNASKLETISDSKNDGAEIWLYNEDSELKELAESVLNNLEQQGYTNRGVKYSEHLYVLKYTESPTMLIECCFVDDIDDAALYDEQIVSNAITDAIIAWKKKKEPLDNLPKLMYNESNIKTNADFIDYVSKVAMWDWYKTKRVLPSVVIAQAIKESAWGKSELAINAKALFGIKKNGWTGDVYIKQAKEQKPDGTYYTVDNTEWRKYNSWFESIIDHNVYLETRKVTKKQKEPNWSKVIGCEDYKLAVHYLQNAEYAYATSITYEESLIKDYIEKYGLVKFDTVTEADFKEIENILFSTQAPSGMSYYVVCGEYKGKQNAEAFSKSLASRGIINRVILREETK